MASSICVAVRVRPLTQRERSLLIPTQSSSNGIYGDGSLTSTPTQSSAASHRSLRPIIRVLDQRVLIFDPPESNPIQQAQRQILARLGTAKKVKDMRFCFDRVFEESATQEEVYEGSAKDLISDVLNGFNATVFAYGATGCGKTHTITGTPEAPGIVFLLMKDLFNKVSQEEEETLTEISISYLEIYNETIRDLLNPNSSVLNLRESNSSVSVPGLSTLTPQSATDVINLISSGNSQRTVHGTDANAVSSRSHAVLSVNIRRKPKTAGLIDDWTVATLSVIDLAGSERASSTKNKGDRLLEGANINKSLLALGNCINALCDPKARGGHVPYRNSKLTRLLKHSLGGNCRTLMIVCVAPTSAHYDETHNTLQYANRAKEIKTKAIRNIISVDRHVSQYVQVIFQLRQELEDRKKNDLAREDRLKKEIRRERLELDSSILKLKKHWQDYLAKARPAGCAQGRLEALEHIRSVLSIWNQTILSDPQDTQETNLWLTKDLHSIFSTITTELNAARQAIEQGKIAKSMYEACIGSLGRAVEKNSGLDGKATFDKEVQDHLENASEMILESSKNEGKAETLANMVAQVAQWLVELTAQFLTKQSSEHSCSRFGQATKTALESLRFSTSNSFSSSSRCLIESSNSSFSSPNVYTTTHSFLPQPTKTEDSPSLSTESNSSVSLPKRDRRSSITTSKSTTTYLAKRISPRKHVVSTNRTFAQPPNGGILKSRSSSGLLTTKKAQETKTNDQSFHTNTKPAGVRWRDVESDGDERLESFDRSASSVEPTDDSMMSLDQSSILLNPPSLTSSNVFSNQHELNYNPTPATSAINDLDKSVMTKPSDSSTTTGLTNGFGGRSNRMKAGYLSRNKASRTMVNTLDSLGEEDEGDVTVKVSSQAHINSPIKPISLPPSISFTHLSLANKDPNVNTGSSTMSGTNKNFSSFGLTGQSTMSVAKGIKDRRRESMVGPIRKPKPFRRQSLNIYGRQSGRESLASSSLSSLTSGVTGSLTGQNMVGENLSLNANSTRLISTLRATRVPILNSNNSIEHSGNLSLSPKKLIARKHENGAGIGRGKSGIGGIVAGRRSLAIFNHELSSDSKPNPQSGQSQSQLPSSRARRVSLLPTRIISNLNQSTNQK
ncbi:hypothetical protein O181_010886 [Austropuccinia psidii MF-1]|uniref:Kinesin motor domain-containing protein n=1 Tax=Austropuccinia psidii MF-1 TaxID=1389203 RepID=A0A9Q3BUQ8_9BASI|nr:hypothetical protein [Austropuccinia psidii MF-1]